MTEAGGPTNQSGVYYQNSIAALFLGRLCDGIARPDRDAVIAVRVEAPVDVDDIVVTHRDGHRTFIQAKENVRVGESAWVTLWRNIEAQFWGNEFEKQKDRLLFHVGEIREAHSSLRELCARSYSSPDYDEWISRLNEAQRSLLKKIAPLFEPAHMDPSELLSLFKHVEVEIRPLYDIERDMVPYWIPVSNKTQAELFRLLRDRVGGAARLRCAFDAEELISTLESESGLTFAPQPSLDDLGKIVSMCGGPLKQYSSTFGTTGYHLKRPIVRTIVEWANQPLLPGSVDNFAFLLDRAGMGKTTICRDVLLELENAGTPVLAIRADQLSGITTAAELQRSLCLPDSAERVLRRLAANGRVVLLIDQIDALSLSLARDQTSLNFILAFLARVRLIPGVRVLVSCRTFDLNNDPRLRNIDSSHSFKLDELTDNEVKGVVEKLGANQVNWENLSPATKELLRIPLHLDLFARAVSGNSNYDDSGAIAPGQLKSLQDLYTILWQNVVRLSDAEAPSVSDRENAIRLLSEEMNRTQRTSVPKSIFSASNNEYLEPASRWLASQGILGQSGARFNDTHPSSEWSFLHQTFFDFCYAKHFVEEGRSLFQTVRGGNQGLFARPQVVHVLEYLRGTNSDAYLAELNKLVNASSSEIRFHIRDHVLRWFGSLSEPNHNESLLARRMLVDANKRASLLRVARGNRLWFEQIRGSLGGLLAIQDDTVLDQEILPYLYSMLETAPAEVITMVRPYLSKNEQWKQRLSVLLRRIKDWTVPEAVSLFEQRFRESADADLGREYQLKDIARADPRACCRLIRIALDRILQARLFLYEADGEKRIVLTELAPALETLNGSTIVEALISIVKADPGYFLETMLPWLEQVVEVKGPPAEDSFSFRHDALSYYWHESLYVVHRQINQAFITAFTEIANCHPLEFVQITERIQRLPYCTPQRYLATAYKLLVESNLYVAEACEFLLSDRRRFDLGDFEQYDSRQLISALVPRLNDEQYLRLEAAILSYDPSGKVGIAKNLQWRGLDKLHLLHSLPTSKMSSTAIKVLGELERKFPGVRASDLPITGGGGFVGPPISHEASKKMSNDAWLGAMARYKGKARHQEFLKGGARELAGVLARSTKEEPERFFALAMEMPLETDQSYVRAIFTGLADALTPADRLFNAIRRFAVVADPETRSAISWALRKRVAVGVPEDLIELLKGYVASSPGKDEWFWRREEEADLKSGRNVNVHGGPYSSYLNSVRGSAFGTLMRVFDQLGDRDGINRKWLLLDSVVGEESTAMRAGAVEELLYLLGTDNDRAVLMFEQLLDGHTALLRSHFTHDFIYHASPHYYFRMKPYIEAMMLETPESVQQRGAELACIASISESAMESQEAYQDAKLLASRAISGSAPWRRGAANVFASNLFERPDCASALISLAIDEDKQVQSLVSEPFRSLREEHILSLRAFIEIYASSRSLSQGIDEFTEYLWNHALVDPVWALSVVEMILDNPHSNQIEMHFDASEKLIRLVINVYNDPTVETSTRERAMDLFDRLMEKFEKSAQTVLEEWDRK